MSDSLFYEWENECRRLKEQGDALQKQGLKLVKIANSGLANLAPVAQFGTTITGLANDYPALDSIITSFYESGKHTVTMLRQANNSISSSLAPINSNVNTALSALTASIVSAGTVAEKIIEIVPECADVIFQAWPPNGLQRGFTYEELDTLLSRFDKNLPARRRGAWQTFDSVSEDSVAQASHTIRDILAKIIAKEAANEKLETCAWYHLRKKEKPDFKPSMKERVQLLLYGPSEDGLDQKHIDEIEEAVSQYVDDDGTLKKVAHGSKSFSKQQAKLSMEKTEELLYLILKRIYQT